MQENRIRLNRIKLNRIKLVFAFSVIMGFFLCGRLFRLQIIECKEWARKAVSQRGQGVSLQHNRASICDRVGRNFTDIESKSKILCLPSELTKEGFEFLRKYDVDITGSKKQVIIIEEVKNILIRKILESRYTGIYVVSVAERYGTESLANHIIGYLHPTEGRGMAGIEYAYEQFLKNENDTRITQIVDGHNKPIPGLGWRYQGTNAREIQNVKRLHLTLDLETQKKVERIMDERAIKKGAIIIMNARDGQVLAMASRPNINPNCLGEYPNYSSVRSDSPFLNRALSSYPPGSLFNLLVAAAALEERVVRPESVVYDEGYIKIGSNVFRCSESESEGHGVISFAQAMAYSCNTVFIKVGLKIGVKKIIDLAKEYGIGQTGILGLKEETIGKIPLGLGMSADDADKVNFLLGQKDVFLTPLQVAGIMQSIANNGLYHPPSIVLGLKDADGNWIRRFASPSIKRTISIDTSQIIRRILEGVVSYGTGKDAQIPVGAAGKSGTVKTGRKNEQGKELYYGWFAGYAPAHNPHLVCVVFLEDCTLEDYSLENCALDNDSRGGVKAAGIFAELLKELL